MAPPERDQAPAERSLDDCRLRLQSILDGDPSSLC